MSSKFWDSKNYQKPTQIDDLVSMEGDMPMNSDDATQTPSRELGSDAMTVLQYSDDPTISSSTQNLSASAIAQREIAQQDVRADLESPMAKVAIDDPEAWYRQGDLYRNAGKLDVALACYHKTIELQPPASSLGESRVGFSWVRQIGRSLGVLRTSDRPSTTRC